jgi:hypothetical protein
VINTARCHELAGPQHAQGDGARVSCCDPYATSFIFQIISVAGTGHTEIFRGSLDEFWPKVEA